MKIQYKQITISSIGALLFSACAGQPSIPKVKEVEVENMKKHIWLSMRQ